MDPIDIGRVRVTSLVEVEEWRLPAALVFPHLTQSQLECEAAKWGPGLVDLESGDLLMAINCFLITTPSKTILVDTGNGNDKNRPFFGALHHMFDTDFLDQVVAAAGSIDHVDTVISTHFHPDHCGWNTRLEHDVWVPTFPNADYLYVRAEIDHFRSLAANAVSATAAGDFAETYADSLRPIFDAGLAVEVELPHVMYDDGETRVWAQDLAGHTPGHLVVHVGGWDAHLVIAGDTVHHPFQLSDLTRLQRGDVDPSAAARARSDLVQMCLERDALVLPAHFRAPIAGRFTGSVDRLGFEWCPGSRSSG